MATMKLPAKGQPVSVEELIDLARNHNKPDIVTLLQHNSPAEPFPGSDGCSMWINFWRHASLYPACFWHDVRYWAGVLGDDVARLLADLELARDVAELTGDAVIARTMFVGVGVGGTEDLDTPFCWGFGRKR